MPAIHELSDSSDRFTEGSIQYEAPQTLSETDEVPGVSQVSMMAEVEGKSDPLSEVCDFEETDAEAEDANVPPAIGNDGNGKPPVEPPTTGGEYGEPEDNSDRPTKEVNEGGRAEQTDSVAVERMMVDRTPVTAVLCEHTEENAKIIATPLKEGDIVALEALGYQNDEEREWSAVQHAALLSSKTPPETAEKLLEMEGASQEVRDTKALLKEMLRTDKAVVLLDVTKDHPGFALLEEAERDYATYIGRMRSLAPIDESRTALHNYIYHRAEAVNCRDDVIAEQLEELFRRTNESENPPSVSIRLGAMHHRALDRFRTNQPEKVRQESDERVRNIEQKELESFATARARDGDMEGAMELADKALLAKYAKAAIGVSDESAYLLLGSFSSERVESVMGQLRQGLASPDQTLDAKAQHIISTLQEALVSHLQEVAPDLIH